MRALLPLLLIAVSGLGAASAGYTLARGLRSLLVEADPRAELPPCLEIGPPFHHRFRENCEGFERTPDGVVAIRTNRYGLREPATPGMLQASRRVLVVGDSYVEGWWMSGDQALPALLSASLPDAYFVNAGLRGTGPMLQARRLSAWIAAYRPEAVLWLLNETDPIDDRFACAVAEDAGGEVSGRVFGTPDFAALRSFERWPAWLSETPLLRSLRRKAFERSWKELVEGGRAERCEPCQGVREFLREARRAGVPVWTAFLANEGRAHAAQYSLVSSGATDRLLACLEKEGAPAFRGGVIGPKEEELDALYVEGDHHFSPEGNVRVKESLLPWLRELLSGKKKNPASAREGG